MPSGTGISSSCRRSRTRKGFYSKPRVDRELLAKYNEGIIVSSACLAGEVAQHLMADDQAAAREAASWYAELFKDRYYLEVQAHESEGQAVAQRARVRARRASSDSPSSPQTTRTS